MSNWKYIYKGVFVPILPFLFSLLRYLGISDKKMQEVQPLLQTARQIADNTISRQVTLNEINDMQDDIAFARLHKDEAAFNTAYNNVVSTAVPLLASYVNPAGAVGTVAQEC